MQNQLFLAKAVCECDTHLQINTQYSANRVQ